MNIIIIAHERSLNKAEGLLRAYRIHNVTLITEHQPDVELKPYVKYATRLFINKGFELVNIINEIPFPTPLNVICSPNHIKNVVPATKDIVVVNLKDIPGSITKFPAFSNPTETP